MTHNTFLKFTGPRTSTASFLVHCSQLSIIPFAARIYCDVHENSVFAKISRLLDSTQGCCTTMTSQTVIPDHVPRNESSPSRGEII